MTKSGTTLAVRAAGMVTAAGFNARATCAAIRAGISGIRKDNIWDAAAGEFLSVGRPCTPQWWEGPDMLAELAAPAVYECFQALPNGIDPGSVPIFVLLSPAERAQRPVDLSTVVRDELQHRLGIDPAPRITMIDGGRTGILLALKQTLQLFARGRTTHSIVVGVDTFLRQRVVESFIARRRVLTADNSNGFIPGEAACAVLMAPSGQYGGGELRIIGWGEGYEKGTIDSDLPLSGDGLTQALRHALDQAGIPMAGTDYWLTDQNAEHYKAKECTVAQIRLERRDRPAVREFKIWHPIEYLGEIGSAIGPCLLGLGYLATQNGYAPGPVALMHVGEDNGHRTAFVLHWAEGN